MTRRGLSISTLLTKSAKSLPVLLLSFSFLWMACGAKAPEDHYFQFALMKEWGKHNRGQTGRALDQVITHPEENEPLSVALEVGASPADLLGFVLLGDFEPLAVTSPPDTAALPQVPISMQQNILADIFREQKLEVAYWQLKNGRLEGGQNLVVVHFTPRAFSEMAIKTDFLMLFAIVHGAQGHEQNTIDAVRGVASGEDGEPLMILEAQAADYIAYLREQIEIQEWENRLQLKKF